ncbi:MAG: hypothetical protein KIT84_05780 [Labilithrix sp.]|nr:hypothetical protein [Labilithrix sp.]
MGVPRFGLTGDIAVVEHATRHVWTGETLVGAPTRFGFSHLGPFFFYFAAPFQAAFGNAATGVYFAATLVNAAAAAGIAAGARLFARRAHAIAALFVVLAWFAAFGSVAASPWPPHVVVLPLAAFLFNAAMVARGKSGAAYPALVFGVFALQTHVATALVFLVVTAAAVVSFFVVTRKETRPDVLAQRWRLGIAGCIGLILFVPPIVETIVAAQAGNIQRAIGFFTDRSTPWVSIGAATQEWMTMMAWLPYRVARLSLLKDDFVPVMASTDEMYVGTSTFPALMASIHVGAAVTASMIAAKRKDAASLGLLGVGALADALAILSLTAVAGTNAPFIVFWTSAASSVLWIGIFATVFSALGAALLRFPKVSNVAATPLIIVALAGAVTTASLQRLSLARHPAGPGSQPQLRPDITAAYGALKTKLQKEGLTPVVHLDAHEDLALGFFLELEKDRFDVRTTDKERRRLGSARADTNLVKPFHLWIGSAATPHRLAKCTEQVAKSGDLVVVGGPKSIDNCDDAAAPPPPSPEPPPKPEPEPEPSAPDAGAPAKDAGARRKH